MSFFQPINSICYYYQITKTFKCFCCGESVKSLLSLFGSMRLEDLANTPIRKFFSREKINGHICGCLDLKDEVDFKGGEVYKLKESEKGRYTYAQYLLKEKTPCPYKHRCARIPGMYGSSWRKLTGVPFWPFCPFTYLMLLGGRHRESRKQKS